MTTLAGVLKDALCALQNDPWLFAPKLFIAFLYSIAMVGAAGLALDALLLSAPGAAPSPAAVFGLLSGALGMLALIGAIWVLDVLFNAAYSLALDARFSQKKYYWLSCLAFAVRKARVVIPAVAASTFLSALLLLPFVLLLFAAALWQSFAWFFLGAVLVAAALLFSNFAFFTVYPVSVLEQKRAAGVLCQSMALSLKRPAGVLGLSLFSVAVSLLGFLFSFLVSSTAFLFLFVLARALVALLATYQVLLNPVFYLAYVRRAEAGARIWPGGSGA